MGITRHLSLCILQVNDYPSSLFRLFFQHGLLYASSLLEIPKTGRQLASLVVVFLLEAFQFPLKLDNLSGKFVLSFNHLGIMHDFELINLLLSKGDLLI